MRTFTQTIEIAAPASQVWRVMSDTDRWHEWTPSITNVKRLDPFAVGMRALVRQPRLPAALWKVTAIEPGASFTWESNAPGFHATGRHSVEVTANGSRATLSLELKGVLGDFFGWLTRTLSERYVAFEARGLKARSENPAYHHSGLNAA